MSDPCCHNVGGAILCSFTEVFDVRIGKWCFDFSERFGPLLLNRRTGMPLKHQPDREDHPFWPVFEKWFAEYKKNRPASPGNDVRSFPEPDTERPNG